MICQLVQPAYATFNTSVRTPCSTALLQSCCCYRFVNPECSKNHLCTIRQRVIRASSGAVQAAVQSTHTSGNDCSSGSSQFPIGAPGPPHSTSGGDGGDDFGLNYGEAVLVLREDLPLLFQQDMRFHIFRDDVTFRTPSLHYLTGLWKYRLVHRAGRWLGNLLYRDVQLSVARMWQAELNKRELRVRCCISGQPRLSFAVDDAPLAAEFISTYTFDSHGKIFEHQVDQIIPPESPFVKLLEWLVERLQPGAALPQPQLPIPGLRDGTISSAWHARLPEA